MFCLKGIGLYFTLGKKYEKKKKLHRENVEMENL